MRLTCLSKDRTRTCKKGLKIKTTKVPATTQILLEEKIEFVATQATDEQGSRFKPGVPSILRATQANDANTIMYIYCWRLRLRFSAVGGGLS